MMGDLDVACLLVYANRITVPPAGNESISLNIEHTRPLKYKIEMSRVDTKLVGNIPVATTTSATAGFATIRAATKQLDLRVLFFRREIRFYSGEVLLYNGYSRVIVLKCLASGIAGIHRKNG